MDIRKYGVAIAIAILTAILIGTTADAFAPNPDYKDCYGPARGYAPGVNEPVAKQLDMNGNECTVPPIDREAQQTCIDDGGQFQSVFDENGCTASYTCSYCQKEYDEARAERSLNFFLVAIAMSLVAIVLGFWLPLGSVHEWVGLGFIIGGVIGLFIGTVAYWGDLSRWLRPLVILLELLVVLFIVYRRVSQGPQSGAERSRTKKK